MILPPVASVSVSLADSQSFVGEATQATATLRDAQGNELERSIGRVESWTPSVATVASNWQGHRSCPRLCYHRGQQRGSQQYSHARRSARAPGLRTGSGNRALNQKIRYRDAILFLTPPAALRRWVSTALAAGRLTELACW